MVEPFLTTAQATMAGQLQGSLRAVPAVPGKLVFAFLNTTLGPSCHTAGVDEVSLPEHNHQNAGSQQPSLGDICPKLVKHLPAFPLSHPSKIMPEQNMQSHFTSQMTL